MAILENLFEKGTHPQKFCASKISRSMYGMPNICTVVPHYALEIFTWQVYITTNLIYVYIIKTSLNH